jgi:thiamine-phosphate pyrophosphorylase
MRNSLRKKFDLSVYFIADPSVCTGRSLFDVVRLAVSGGVTMVQLRDKSGLFENAQPVREFLKTQGIPFIVNDNVDLAMMIDADGVHLGQGDMEPASARDILGPQKIIGVTAFEEDHFRNIDHEIADYAGTGPFYATPTKPGKKVLGPRRFAELVKLSPVPIVGIGGITPENAAAVIESGAAGVAMMRAISESADPALAAKKFANTVTATRLGKVS